LKFIRQVENIFEKYIEGYFNNKFSSELQPVEVARQIIKEMETEKTVGVSKIYVPNSYSVYISKADYERIAPYRQSICAELVQYLKKQAQQKEYTVVGGATVEILEGEDLSIGKFRLVSSFSEPLPQEPELEAPVICDEQEKETTDGDTRVFGIIQPVSGGRPAVLQGVLTVIDGPDIDLQVNVAGHRVNLGRRASNELPLTDLNTSRLQAYIVYEDKHHVIYDANSLNGTYVNGHRILHKQLQSGDKVKIGNTVILYEVKSFA
jgi:hypothetical protein